MTQIHISSTLSSFSPGCIGTKVWWHDGFRHCLTESLLAHDTTKDRVAGQHFVTLPEVAYGMVSAGVGPRTQDPKDYHVRIHRGRAEAFLRRDKAGTVSGVACVVYTRSAYLADPEAGPDAARDLGYATHVLVAVLAFCGPPSTLTPTRFVANLAGGNNEALAWTVDEIRTKASEVLAYDKDWCVVADPESWV